MVTTWVLVGFLVIGGKGGPMVINDIASRESCERLIVEIGKQTSDFVGEGLFQPGIKQMLKCHAVQKVVSGGISQ